MKGQETTPKSSLGEEGRVRISTKLEGGRWKREEHELFLQGLEIHGRDWKKIESLVGTRTGPQIRSHAQKYFNKVCKDSGSKSGSIGTIKIMTGSLSNSSSNTGREVFKDPDTTNLRKRKEEEKFKQFQESSISGSNIGIKENTTNFLNKLRIPNADLNNLNLNPLLSEEKGGIQVGNTLENTDEVFGRKDSSRTYSEQEVLTLIKHLVKEFVNIMNRFSTVQQPLLAGNTSMMNLNSVLLLSLMSGDLQKSSVASSISNIFNLNKSVDKPISMSNYQTPDLISMLKSQLPGDSSPSVSCENLTRVPKACSWINLNFPNLGSIQGMGNMSQSQNTYNLFSQLQGCTEGREEMDLPLKRYDSTSGEGRYESDTNPTLEAKVDEN